MPFPVFVVTGEVPKVDGPCFLIGKNGTYIQKDTGLLIATVPVAGVPHLAPIAPKVATRLPKIPAEVMTTAVRFFRAMYHRYKGEAALLLHYSAESDQYKLSCPIQDVSGGGVEYASDERLPGYQLVGTIHSHANFGAGHSSIDAADEKYFDGVHITIGHNNEPFQSYATSIVVNGFRFHYPPEAMIIGIRRVIWNMKYSKKRRLRFRYYGLGGLNDGPIGYYTKESVDGAPVPKEWDSAYFDLIAPEGVDLSDFDFPPEWRERVTKKTYKIIKVGKWPNWRPTGNIGYDLDGQRGQDSVLDLFPNLGGRREKP